MLKIALLGCGAIGSVIASAISNRVIDASLEYVYDTDTSRAQMIANSFDKKPKVALSIGEVLSSKADIVVEAASQEAVKLFAQDILKSGKSMMIMSVGALADETFFRGVKKIAREKSVKIYLPSGAIGSLDSLKSASIAGIRSVTLTTTKSVESLRSAPYFKTRKLEPEKIKSKLILYDGNALDAIKHFPANVNVAVALSIAGIGVEKTRVRVVADPEVKKNIHEIDVKGDFGEFSFRVGNLPFPQNPKTSYLAALSAIATLRRITSTVEIGT